MQQNTQTDQQATSSLEAKSPQTRLSQLKELLDQGLITQQDYDAGKAEVLKQITQQ